MRLLRDLSVSSAVAGFITVLVGFTSSAVIVFQAAHALGATTAQVASWMWALGIGMGLTCIGLSMRQRLPVVTAWCTPGAALLITAVDGLSLGEAIGAFMINGLLIAVAGFSGIFERSMSRIPLPLGAAMLAGVLVRFGLDAFLALRTRTLMVLGMFLVYLLLRRLRPRYAALGALVTGAAIAAAQGLLHLEQVPLELARPEFMSPAFSLRALVGVALPLFVVTMASQNMPGVAAIRACGYTYPISVPVGVTGLATLLLAPFGAFTLNLAAITAAICMGREAHEDPARRYVAAVAAGVFYLVVGLFGATVGALFAALPRELVAAIAGLALLGTIGNGLASALAPERERESALITFLVTASGLTLWGVGSAFWGLVAGTTALVIMRVAAGTPR